MAAKHKATRSGTKKPAHGKKAGKLITAVGEIIDDALARSATKPSETDAAVAIARAWLAKAGFHEDPTGGDPTRVEIQNPGWDGRSHEHYVDVRVYIPALDIDHVVDGTHPDDIAVEAAP